VARRAGAGSAAGTFDVEVVGLRDVEQVGTVADGEGVRSGGFVDKGYVALFAGFWRLQMAVPLRRSCRELFRL